MSPTERNPLNPMTSFNDIPAEIQLIIFNYLVQSIGSKQSAKLMLVCKNWFYLLGSYEYKHLGDMSAAAIVLKNCNPLRFDNVYGPFIRYIQIDNLMLLIDLDNPVLPRILQWNTWANICKLEVLVIQDDSKYNNYIKQLITSEQTNINKLIITWSRIIKLGQPQTTTRTPKFIELLEINNDGKKRIQLDLLQLHNPPTGFLNIYNNLKKPQLQGSVVTLNVLNGRSYIFRNEHFKRLMNIGLQCSLKLQVVSGTISIEPDNKLIESFMQKLQKFSGHCATEMKRRLKPSDANAIRALYKISNQTPIFRP